MNHLTLVIPTYNRYNDIYRHLKYINIFLKGINVIVMDGTPPERRKKIDTSLFTNIFIEYHYFDLGINERIKIGVSKVSTKYTCIIGDDDRLVKEGVDMSINFLDENIDFIAAYGKTYGYCPKRGCLQMYNYSSGPRSANKTSRVLRAMHFYTPQLYCSIWRTPAINDVVKIAATENWSSGQIFEVLLVLAGNLYGNHQCLDVPYWERAIVNPTVVKGIDRTTSVPIWMEWHHKEFRTAKNALKNYFGGDEALIDLAFAEYKLFAKNRELMEKSGAMERKYRQTIEGKFPSSKILTQKPPKQ